MRISRGFNPEPIDEAAPEPGAPAPPHTLEYWLTHDRITALERLARLHADGTLTDAEFAAEKQRILSLPSEELILRPPPAEPPRGPSLLGRLLSWRLLVLGILLGLALAAFTQPEDTLRMLDDLARTLRG